MAIQTGATLPTTTVHLKEDGSITETSLAAWSKGRKVVLIVVPGAFTPTCSARHLPGYVKHAGAFMEKGIDAIGCMAVNDVHVMKAWGEHEDAEGKIDMIADPFGQLRMRWVSLLSTRLFWAIRGPPGLRLWRKTALSPSSIWKNRQHLKFLPRSMFWRGCRPGPGL